MSCVKFIGCTVTVMSPEGNPVQVNPSLLQSVAAQTAIGRSTKISQNAELLDTRIADKIEVFEFEYLT